ncbi:MAG: hypothetical protein GY696_34495 [Gammaproteobacteria bacterium]|nr:hypothetical protein [Gammaproteobacteria bacterium]
MIQSSHRFGLAASSPNLSESSLARWAAVLGFAALTLGPFGLAARALTAHPTNWIQTNLATRRGPNLLASLNLVRVQGCLGAGVPSGVRGGAPTAGDPLAPPPSGFATECGENFCCRNVETDK